MRSTSLSHEFFKTWPGLRSLARALPATWVKARYQKEGKLSGGSSEHWVSGRASAGRWALPPGLSLFHQPSFPPPGSQPDLQHYCHQPRTFLHVNRGVWCLLFRTNLLSEKQNKTKPKHKYSVHLYLLKIIMSKDPTTKGLDENRHQGERSHPVSPRRVI